MAMKAQALSERVSILVIKISSFGDIVQSFPFLTLLKNSRADIELDLLVDREYRDLARLNRSVDNLILFDRREWARHFYRPATMKSFVDFTRRLRGKRYDIGIDLQGLARSGLSLFFSRARRRIGFSNAREFAWLAQTESVEPERYAEVHDVERYLALARKIFALTPAPGSLDWGIELAPSALDEAARIIEPGSYIIINARARWRSKLWSQRSFARTARLAFETMNLKSLLIGAESDIEPNAQIASMAGEAVIDLTGKVSIPTLAALINSARLMISSDSGPAHLAAALDRPVVALFGPTRPGKTGPFGQQHIILDNRRACAPCHKRVCPLKIDCLESISPERVIEAARTLASPPKV